MRAALWAGAMWMKTLGVAVTLMLAAPVAAQTWVTEPARRGVVARGEGLLRQAMLAGHNQARAAFGAAPLGWDAGLAKDARGYARQLAKTDAFRHSTGRRGTEPQGENLWTGTRLAYSYDEMIGHWLGEARAFRPGVLPAVSTTGRFEDVGHYTQIVWPATTRVGCATASSRKRDYLVCRYAVPGNVSGQRLG